MNKALEHRKRIERYIREGRTVSGGKEDTKAAGTEKSTANFTNQLFSSFSQQFGAQSSILSFLTNKMTAMASNPEGFSPEMKAALNTQATQGTAADYAKAQQATNAVNAAHGGNGLPSGVQAQLNAGNAAMAAGEESAAKTNIGIADAQQQQSNYWNAINGLTGTAAMYNPTGYANSGIGGANAVSGLSQAVSQSQQSGFTNTLTNSFAKGLGSSLGSFAGGGGGFGFTSILGGKPQN